MTRISEKELVLPALLLLARAKDAGLTTSEIIRGLRELLQPSGEDLEILAGRTDDKFSQKVRNLKSHDTLTREGVATEDRGRFRITPHGRDVYEQHAMNLKVLIEFPLVDAADGLTDIAGSADVVILDEVVREGETRWRYQEYRMRSNQLRNAAMEHYSSGGKILCEACTFEFGAAYPRIGEGYIQIHHLKPVSYMRGEPLKLSEALANVRPLCANCHQMVHRERPPVTIANLRAILNVSYDYRNL